MDHQDFDKVFWNKRTKENTKSNQKKKQFSARSEQTAKISALENDELRKVRTWNGQNLARERTEKRMSQKRLGEYLNVKAERIAEWERGVRPPGQIIHKLKKKFPLLK